MYLITNTKHCAQPQTGWGAEEPFGESPPPLETINKGPKRCTFLHTRPKTHLGEPRVRETSRAELRKHLSPSLSRNLLETWKLREIFFSPSRPPAHLQQTLELEPASQTRSAPPAAATGDSRRRAGPGETAQSRGPAAAAAGPVAGGLYPFPAPPARRRRRPAARLSALTLAFPRPRPPSTPAEEQKEGSAGSPLGRRGGGGADPSAAAPHTKGLPTPGAASARSSPPLARALTHLQVSVRLSIGTRAARGACRSRAERAGRGGTEGRDGVSAAAGPGSEGKWNSEGHRLATDSGEGGRGTPA